MCFHPKDRTVQIVVGDIKETTLKGVVQSLDLREDFPYFYDCIRTQTLTSICKDFYEVTTSLGR